MKTAQQIRKEIVEAKYPDILSKIEKEIEKNKDVANNIFFIDDMSEHIVEETEIVKYMQDLGYVCELMYTLLDGTEISAYDANANIHKFGFEHQTIYQAIRYILHIYW